jgi:hypothetical protein
MFFEKLESSQLSAKCSEISVPDLHRVSNSYSDSWYVHNLYFD